jgi:hypothetical protein
MDRIAGEQETLVVGNSNIAARAVRLPQWKPDCRWRSVTGQLRRDVYQMTGIWVADRTDTDNLIEALRLVVSRVVCV